MIKDYWDMIKDYWDWIYYFEDLGISCPVCNHMKISGSPCQECHDTGKMPIPLSEIY